MKSTVQTRKARFMEKIARSVIMLFVVFTLAILAWIVLYIMIRGFISSNEVNDPFAGITESVIREADFPGRDFVFIIHNGIRIRDLNAFELNQLYTKNRNYWGPFTGQNLMAAPYIYTRENGLNQAAFRLLLGQDQKFNKQVQEAASSTEMVACVEKTPGAIGYLPAADQPLLKGHAVRILNIRRIVFPLNPGVAAIVKNKQLRNVNTAGLEGIFTGTIANWQELGGVDLPVNPVCMIAAEGFDITRQPALTGKTGNPAAAAIRVTDVAGLQATVASTTGAIGACYYEDWHGNQDNLLSVKHIVTKSNLDIHYIIEAPAASGAWGGISTIILNTLIFIVFTLLFSTPVGVFAAIYLTEYSKQNRLIRILRLGIETLSGIPSIIFGLFGFIFFVFTLKLGIGFMSAVLTITLMILPTIIRTSEEAFKAVPVIYREGSLALGATKLQTIFKVVIPAALPGIVSGVILALGRTVGETAVLIYTMGSNYELVSRPNSSARVLSLHLYNMFAEGISVDRCFATGAILIFVILIVNFSSRKLTGSMYKKSGIHQ